VTLVRIDKNYTSTNLLRQTPGGRGLWDGIQFTEEPVDRCDYFVICNCLLHDVTLRCPRENIWSLIQEPPEPWTKPWHTVADNIARVYTVHPKFTGDKFVHGQTALPWHIDRDYDFLVSCDVPAKLRPLSCVTSAKRVFAGHHRRMDFIEALQNTFDLDLFGRGLRPLESKWDGLAAYRYSLAIENTSNVYYWTEKISDCFLAWTMPIYYGCTRIADYFPAEAMVCIDVEDPHAADAIRDAIREKRWERNLDAIAHARELVLQQYQLFPFLAREIRQHSSNAATTGIPEPVTVAANGRAPAASAPAVAPGRGAAVLRALKRRLRR